MQTLAPFGLKPAYSQSGIIRPGPLALIESAYATSIYQGAPVAMANATAGGYLTAVGAGEDTLWLGAFQGVEYTDAFGRRLYNNFWLASTTLPANADLRAYFIMDQAEMVYQIQCNASLGATEILARAAIGQQYNFTAVSGSTVTGLSAQALDVSSAQGAGDQGQLRVIGLNPGPDNGWTDPYPVVLVQNSAHPYVARVNV